MEQLYDVDAERSVLGAIIIKPDIAYEVMDKLRADDFYRQQHRLVFLTLAAMVQSISSPSRSSSKRQGTSTRSVASRLSRSCRMSRQRRPTSCIMLTSSCSTRSAAR